MKTYLVTGGSGFIGSNFILYMFRQYDDCRIINLDALTYAGNPENLKEVESRPDYTFIHGNICDEKVVCGIFENYELDYIVNFAAESHVDRSIESATDFIHSNVLGTNVLLDNAMKFWQINDGEFKKDCRFLQVSTDEVYGSLGETGLFSEETPLAPRSPYSASKAAADLLVNAYAETYGLPVNITRCSNNYGAMQYPEKLIPLMIDNALNKKKLPVYGDGMQVRDWLYVEDHCRAIDLVLQKGKAGEVYNIGGNNEQYNIDIVKKIIAYLYENIDSTIDESLITHVKDRLGHDRRYGVDASKIKRKLGWEAKVNFDQGLTQVIQWYLDNQSWVKNTLSREDA